MVAAIVGWQYGFGYFTFLYSEVFILFARTMHTIIRSVTSLLGCLGYAVAMVM